MVPTSCQTSRPTSTGGQWKVSYFLLLATNNFLNNNQIEIFMNKTFVVVKIHNF